MKQRHYHIYMFCIALLLIASGGLIVYAIYNGWGWATTLSCVIICITGLTLQWEGASFIPRQINYFLGSLRYKDSTSRFPATADEELKHMYETMNHFIQSYGHNQMEIETKRMYYDRILRIMTHELRNSITPIISLSEDMKQREYSAEDTREAVEVINDQCTYIKSFLDSYYELTHLPKPELKEVDAKSLLLHIERLYSDKNIVVQCTQGLKLFCDEKQIIQILVNIVKNAIEAPATAITVTGSAPEGHPRITISDNGPGIPHDKQEEIFLPFYTSKSTGSGIGLALSRQIMSLHKGTLTCSSNELGGAVFILQF